MQYFQAHREIGPAQRYLSWLEESALPASDSPLIIFIDEIDATRSFSFSTDDLFAGIRQLHNERASDSSLNRLTFCLLGAALPSNLIRDPRSTSFNIGKRIELRNFTEQEAKPFANALGSDGPRKLSRVLHWTGGHPFLTQALCADIVAVPGKTVDELVTDRYLSEQAQETDSNLCDVGNRILGTGDPEVTSTKIADTLSGYRKMLKGGIADDETNLSAARIKMSGVARLDGNRLVIRNRIFI